MNDNKTAFYAPQYSTQSPFEKVIDSIAPLTDISALRCEDEAIASNARRIYDEWKNTIASIGAGNSLTQFTTYSFERLGYAECASLATDTMIAKAIRTITNEMFTNGGDFFIGDKALSEWGEKLINTSGLIKAVKQATTKAFEFGGAFIYIHTTDTDLTRPLYIGEQTTSRTRFLSFKVLEPWQFAPTEVNSYNPIADDYMQPNMWWVMGVGNVHASRLMPVEFFSVSYMYKPLFNYLGLPLSFYMKSYVATADTIRKSLGDIFLRFSTNIIKTTNHKVANEEGLKRVKHINQTRNNLGAIVLGEDEEFLQVNTSLGGLEGIASQAYEFLVASSLTPATKLLGIEPTGFQSTGEHTLKNYYDTIADFQALIKDKIARLAEILFCFKGGEYVEDIQYRFAELGAVSESEKLENINRKGQFLAALTSADIITPEEALQAIKDNDLDFSFVNTDNRQIEEPLDDIDLLSEGDE